MKIYTQQQIEEYTQILKDLVNTSTKYLAKINAKGRKRYPNDIPKYAFLKDFIISQTPLLVDECYNMQTKIYWIINNIHSWNNPLVHCKNEKCNIPFLQQKCY